MKKWMALIGFNCLFIVGCAGQDTPSDQVSDEVGSADVAIRCPQTCNDSGCRLADGTCSIACNACLCKQRGGTPDSRCLFAPDVSDERDLDAEALTPIGGGQCGGVVCGKGTYCCNPSCSTCEPFGASCTQQSCN